MSKLTQDKVLWMALDGDVKLLQAWGKLTGAEQVKARRSAMRKAAKQAVLPRVKSLTPVDRGDLLASLRIIPGGRGYVGVFVGIASRDEIGIGPDEKHFWPAAVEFGHGNAAPRSFLRAGLDQTKNRAIQIVGQSLRAFFNKQAKAQ